MKSYTVGIIFNHDRTKILLMHKNRPDWQRGKLNGVGGKIEPGEESVECLSREVNEETNLDIDVSNWRYFAKLHQPGSWVDFYTTVYVGDINLATTMTDEEVEWVEMDNLPDNLVPNLKWLIPMALDAIQDKRLKTVEITYED